MCQNTNFVVIIDERYDLSLDSTFVARASFKDQKKSLS